MIETPFLLVEIIMHLVGLNQPVTIPIIPIIFANIFHAIIGL